MTQKASKSSHGKNGQADAGVQAILDVLAGWKKEHAKAQIDAYRLYPFTVRVRIIDPDFRDIDRIERHDAVWRLLDRLPEEVASDIGMLVLVTPGEKKRSGPTWSLRTRRPIRPEPGRCQPPRGRPKVRCSYRAPAS
jgi:hypothetical protein